MPKPIYFFGLFLVLLLTGCKEAIPVLEFQDPETVAAFNEDGSVNAVIEIPAGSNMKIEYDYGRKAFYPDQKNGKDRVIEYLPYPGNYGFVPSTKADTAQGGDGDALDILVLSSSLPTGTVIPVKPIAMLALLDNGEQDDKILAIPAQADLQVFKAQDYEMLIRQFPKAQVSIQYWFESYNPQDTVSNLQWHDEKIALKSIRKWAIPVKSE